MGIIIHQANS